MPKARPEMKYVRVQSLWCKSYYGLYTNPEWVLVTLPPVVACVFATTSI